MPTYFWRSSNLCRWPPPASSPSALTVRQVPLAVINAAAYGTIVYNMSGLNHNSWEPFGYFLLVIVLCNLVALSFCQVRSLCV